MAKAAFSLPDEFLTKITKLGGKTDEICEKMLDAGATVVEDKVRSNLKAVIGKGTKYKSHSTGDLVKALGVSPARQDKNGNLNVKIGFAEQRADGESNAKIAAVLEYGKSGQPPKPFMKPAKSASKNAAVAAMKNTFESEVQKL